MTLSEDEIVAIVRRATGDGEPSVAPSWAVEVRCMLNALTELEFRPGRASPLVKLCEAGAFYGWRQLQAATHAKLLSVVSPKAGASLRRDLRRSLERLTRPCLKLEQTSLALAMNSIGIQTGPADTKPADRMFLGNKPSHRLFALFKEFPVLARLWSQLISQCCDQVTEVLSRFAADRRALARTSFGGQLGGTIVNIRASLSDSHNHGRTVMELQFEAGAVIYKPRSGDGEWEWGSLLEWMNAQSFQPRLKAGRVLRRKGYCWMERIEAGPFKNKAEAQRFHERIGGLIAAAYLLRAVDCHRDNLIASGEDPVVVDADALWHVSPVSKTESPFEVLSRTGFFPNSKPRSLQSRSSVLSRDEMRQHKRDMMNGFSKAWDCLLGTGSRRRAFTRRVRRIQSRERRWICRATETYAAIRQDSLQPAALRSGIKRNRLLARLCKRNGLASEIIAAELDALKLLDIPYLAQDSKERILLNQANMPIAVWEALRRVLT